MASPKTKEIRVRRRNEAARMIETSEEVALVRRPDGEGPDGPIRAAVLAALLIGQPVAQVARTYNLPYHTVYQWSKAFDISNPIRRRDQLSESLLIFVQREIQSLMAISLITEKEEWVMGQNASEMAQYVAVKTEKLMAILQVFGRAAESRQKLTEETVDIEGA